MRVLIFFMALLIATQAGAKSQEVNFQSADGITVFGDLYRATDNPLSAPIILLFHQGGGDARGEYGMVVGRLLNAGYHALAIDQRVGGERFGQENRTMTNLDVAFEDYCAAYPDLVAALKFVETKGFRGPRIAWGSSYSASLAIKLAAEHGDSLAAVLAFSPASGASMQDCMPEPFVRQLTIPLLALRPIGEMEVAYVPAQLASFREMGHETYVADPGVHGSSMLSADRVGASTDATWDVVLAFIAKAVNASPE